MTILIRPEFDREGLAVSYSGSKAANTMRLPQTRNLACLSPHGGPSDPPPFPTLDPSWTSLFKIKPTKSSLFNR